MRHQNVHPHNGLTLGNRVWFNELGESTSDIKTYHRQQQAQLNFINSAWEDVDINTLPCYPIQES